MIGILRDACLEEAWCGPSADGPEVLPLHGEAPTDLDLIEQAGRWCTEPGGSSTATTDVSRLL
jgi:hypothetical protein